MSIHSFSDDDENYELAELEAESQALQQAYAAQLAALEAEETGAPLAPPATAAASALEAENAKLKAQLAALESASAIKSTIRHDSELAKQKAELEKMAAENAKLTEALASGVGLSKLTTLTPSVVSASKARTASLVLFRLLSKLF